MKSEEKQQFIALSKALFEEGRKLNELLPKQLDRAGKARGEIVGQLSAGRLGAAGAVEIEKQYEDAESAEQLLYDRIGKVAAEISNTLAARLREPEDAEKETPSSPEPGSSTPAPPSPGLTDAQNRLLETRQAELREFDLAMSEFYIATTLMMLHGIVKASIDTCEAFLGRPVGSRELAARVRKVGETFLMDLAGIATKFAFLSTVLEAIRQWQFDPQVEAEQEQIRAATGMARVVKFKLLVERLSGDGMAYAEGIIGQSLSAVGESPVVPVLDIFGVDVEAADEGRARPNDDEMAADPR